MPAIKSEHRTKPDLFKALRAEGDSFGERNDCSVIALSVAAGIPYDKAHAMLEAKGRKTGGSVPAMDCPTVQCLRELGFKVREVCSSEFIGQYPKGHQILKSVTTHHPARFPAVWKNGKTYVMQTRGHILTIVDGQTMDWTAGRAMRAWRIFEVEKAQ